MKFWSVCFFTSNMFSDKDGQSDISSKQGKGGAGDIYLKKNNNKIKPFQNSFFYASDIKRCREYLIFESFIIFFLLCLNSKLINASKRKKNLTCMPLC